MKLIVRTFVVALALTGAAATAPAASANHAIVTGRTSFMPIAVCPPNDPNACSK